MSTRIPIKIQAQCMQLAKEIDDFSFEFHGILLRLSFLCGGRCRLFHCITRREHCQENSCLQTGGFSVIRKTKEEKSVPTKNDEGTRRLFVCADCAVFLLRTLRFVKNCLYYNGFKGSATSFSDFRKNIRPCAEEYFYSVSCGRFAPGFAAKRTPRGIRLDFPPVLWYHEEKLRKRKRAI